MFYEIGHRDGASELDGEVDVIESAADPVDFAASITADLGEVGKEAGSDGVGEPGFAVFGRENDVEENACQGLRHGWFVGGWWGGVHPA